MSFITVSQCKQIVRNYLSASGRGGFLTGTVQSVAPLTVLLESGRPLYAADLYITGHCNGLILNLKHKHVGGTEALQDGVVLRRGLAPGDGVLLIARPSTKDGGSKYILLDRIQPFGSREVDTVDPPSDAT